MVGIPIPFVYYNSNMSFLPLLTKCGSINSLMEKLFSNLHIILSINGHKFKDKILIIIYIYIYIYIPKLHQQLSNID